jgi:hypothetical protein
MKHVSASTLVATLAVVAAIASPVAGALGAAEPPSAAAPATDPRAAGRELTRQFLSGELEPLWRRMTPALQRDFGSLDAFRSFCDQVRAAGDERQLVRETVVPGPGGVIVYTRVARFSGVAQPVAFEWALDGAQRIAGLIVQQVEPGR